MSVAKFPDWDPKRVLETSEFTASVAIGYDWLYDVLTPEQRLEISGSIPASWLGFASSIYANIPQFVPKQLGRCVL